MESTYLPVSEPILDMLCTTLYLAIFPALLTPWSCTYPVNNTHPVVSVTYGTEHATLCYTGAGWTAMAVVSTFAVPLYMLGSASLLMIFKCVKPCAVYAGDDHVDKGLYLGYQYKSHFLLLDFVCKSLIAMSIAFFGRSTDAKVYIILSTSLIA